MSTRITFGTVLIVAGVTALLAAFALLAPVAISSGHVHISAAFAQAQPAGTAAATAKPSTCSIGITTGVDFNFTDCIWIPMMTWLGSWFLTIGGAILVLAGVIFDWLVQTIIINFAGTLQTMGAFSAIQIGWSLFRDISNIVIIGMFTFIAIETILGNTEYGYKKMLARVLIVAVLINFSLLFSEIIIDFGNYTAYQVYAAVAQSPQFAQSGLQSSGGQAATGGGGTAFNFDIAGAFLKPMGITSVWNTQGVLTDFASTNRSGLQAFSFGLVGGLLLIALALVILYGCFLIASRAVLLILLMVTASVAFASYLIPRFAESEFGFRGWWKSLINASIFAPLLMLFLAISLLVIEAASCVVGGQTGGSCTAASQAQAGGIGTSIFTALSNPQTAAGGNGWTVIMLYIFGIGLLFISFRLASSFASSIGGFNVAQAITLAPLAQTSRLAAPILRWTVGQRAYNQQRSLQEGARADSWAASKAEIAARRHDTANNFPLADQARAEAQRLRASASKKAQQSVAAGKRASATYNLMDTQAAKNLIQKGLGIKGFASGQSSKTAEGFAQTAKKRGAEVAAVAKHLQPDAEQRSKIREENENLIREQRKATKEQLETVAAERLKNSQDQAKPVQAELKKAQDTENTAKQQVVAKLDSDEKKELQGIREQLSKNNSEYASQIKEQSEAREKHDKVEQDIKDGQTKYQQELNTAKSDDEKKIAEQKWKVSEEAMKSDLRHENERIQSAQIKMQALESQNPDVQKVRAHFDELRGKINEDATVKAAHTVVDTIHQRIAAINKPSDDASKALREFIRATPDAIKKAGAEADAIISNTVDKGIQRVAESQGTLLTKITGANDIIANEARSKLRGDAETSRLKKVFEGMKSPGEHEGGGDHH